MTDETRIHIRVRGRVQGVGFRRFVERSARGHDLGGWVRNGDDGSVEIVVAGPASRVAAFEDDVRRGPPGSRVDTLDALDALDALADAVDGSADRPFTIRHR